MEARRATHRRRTVGIAIAVAAVAMLVPAFALAHIERASYWPDPAPDTSVKPAAGGSVPAVRSLYTSLKKKEPGKTRVVCQTVPSKQLRKHGTPEQLSKNKSMKALNKDLKSARKSGYKLRESQPAIKISKKKAKKLRKTNIKLLRQCKYKSIQDAVTASHNNDRVEIMPGLYTEPKSRAKPTNDPACAQYKITNDKNQAGAVSYAYQWHCPNDQNLIAVLGRQLTDTPVPQPPRIDRHIIPDAGPCIRCNLQIQGTGASPDAVTIDAGNTASGDGAPIGSVKDVGIRADRADGFVLDNVKVRHAKEHDVYAIETDGSHFDHFKAPYAGEYGLLTFVADHSLIENCDAWGSGDSGLYPGASADLGEGVPPGQRRYGTELRNCDMHHNLLGYSGTDGNAVWLHDNNFYDNSDGLLDRRLHGAGPPGLPAGLRPARAQQLLRQQLQLLPAGVRSRTEAWPERTEPGLLGCHAHRAGPGRHRDVDRRRQRERGTQQPLLRQLAPRRDAVRGARCLRLRRPGQPGGGLQPDPWHDSRQLGHLLPQQVLRQPDGTGAGREPLAERRRLLVGPGRDHRRHQSRLHQRELLVQQHRLQRHRRKRHGDCRLPAALAPDNLPSSCENSPLPGAQHGQVTERAELHATYGAPGCPWFTTPPKP